MVSALAISNVDKVMDTKTIVQMSQTSHPLMTAAMILKKPLDVMMEVAEAAVVPHQINAGKMKGTVIQILIVLAISYVVKEVVLMTTAITHLDFQLVMTVAMTLKNVKKIIALYTKFCFLFSNHQ